MDARSIAESANQNEDFMTYLPSVKEHPGKTIGTLDPFLYTLLGSPAMQKYRLAIWDWNGTLQDDANTLYTCGVQRIFQHFGLPCPPLTQYKREVNHNFMEFYRRHGIPEHVTADDLNTIYKEGLQERGYGTSTPLFPDAVDVVRESSTVIAIQHLVSGCALDILRADVERHGLTPYFTKIIGDVRDKVRVFADLMEKEGVIGSETLVIGDFSHDALAAHAVSAHPILCTRGFHTREDLEPLLDQIPTLRLIDTLAELPDLLHQPITPFPPQQPPLSEMPLS